MQVGKVRSTITVCDMAKSLNSLRQEKVQNLINGDNQGKKVLARITDPARGLNNHYTLMMPFVLPILWQKRREKGNM